MRDGFVPYVPNHFSIRPGIVSVRILFVETQLSGHHKSYLFSLSQACEEPCVAIPLNKDIDFDPSRLYHFRYCGNGKFKYIGMIRDLNAIAKKIQPDIIHFLYGDDLYRSFGLGLSFLYPKAKKIITCHQVRRSFLRDLSYRNLSRKTSALVVHTKKLCEDFRSMKINNVHHIEYPYFANNSLIPRQEALRKLGIDNNGYKTLLYLGGTRFDKGLDILLEALNGIDGKFHLIIAGKEEDIKRNYIEKATDRYKEHVSLFLDYLPDETFDLCINAADVVVLPYRKTFDGASGPLGEAVSRYKMVVGANHKSLGHLIESNDLGRTFESENTDHLRETLQNVIRNDWSPDENYIQYRESLNPRFFQKKYQELYRSLV